MRSTCGASRYHVGRSAPVGVGKNQELQLDSLHLTRLSCEDRKTFVDKASVVASKAVVLTWPPARRVGGAAIPRIERYYRRLLRYPSPRSPANVDMSAAHTTERYPVQPEDRCTVPVSPRVRKNSKGTPVWFSAGLKAPSGEDTAANSSADFPALSGGAMGRWCSRQDKEHQGPANTTATFWSPMKWLEGWS